MEFGIVATLFGLGYYFSNNNNESLQKVSVPSHQLPNQKNIFESSRVEDIQKKEEQLMRDNFERSKKVESTNVVPPNMNQEILTQEPEIKQNSVSESYSAYQSQLAGQTIENFSHDNMVPFFGAHVTQNINERAFESKIANHTGISKYYKPKNSTEHFFQPEQNHHNQNNNDLDLMKDRYRPSVLRTNETPMEQIRVGPGVNQGFSSMGSGGFHNSDIAEMMRPRTVEDTRVQSNPKLTYKGRVVSGQKGSNRGKMGETFRHRVPTSFEMGQDRLFTTVGGETKPTQRSNLIMKETDRTQSMEYMGIPQASINKSEQPGEYQKSTNIQLDSFGISNASLQNNWKDLTKNDYGLSTLHLPPNEREDTSEKTHLANLVSVVKELTTPIQDVLRISKKENFIGSVRPSGNFNRQAPNKITTYDPEDIARTTIKETLIHDVRLGTFYTPYDKRPVYDEDDVPKTTIRETTKEPDKRINVMAQHPKKLTIYDPEDVARTTVKETVLFKREGNVGMPTVDKTTGYILKSNVANAPVTYRQMHVTEYAGVADGEQFGRGSGYENANMCAPSTNKQFTSDNEYVGVADSETSRPQSYADIYNATIDSLKEDTLKGREPTQNNTKLFNSDQNMKVDKLESDQMNQREAMATKIYNSIPRIEDCSVTNMKNRLDDGALAERYGSEMIDALDSNPYVVKSL